MLPGLAVCAPAPTPAPLAPWFDDSWRVLRLGNAHYEVRNSLRNGAITCVVDRATGGRGNGGPTLAAQITARLARIGFWRD